MIVSGTIDAQKYTSKWMAGKPFTLDVDLDVFHVSILQSDVAYSDYVTFRDWYMIVDFDRNKRVVGYTVEGVLEACKRESLKARLLIPLRLKWFGTQYIYQKAIQQVVGNLPVPDANGKLALAPA